MKEHRMESCGQTRRFDLGRFGVLLVILWGLTTGPAAAQLERGSAELGFDIGLISFDDNLGDEDDLRFSIRGGFFFTNNIELETQYFIASADVLDVDATLEAFFLNGVFNFHPKDRIIPYVLLGVGIVQVDTEIFGFDVQDSVLGFQVGVGSRFFINERERFAFRVEYSLLSDDTFDSSATQQTLSVGFLWRFGK